MTWYRLQLLTTLSSHSSPRTVELSEVPMLDRKREAKGDLKPFSQGRRWLDGSAPRSSATTHTSGPDPTERRYLRKEKISRHRHFVRIPALPAWIPYLPPALAHPQLSLPGLGPRKGTPFSLPASNFDRRRGLT